MPIAQMAKSTEVDPAPEPGAPVPPGKIDPDLVKLRRARAKVGIITSAGVLGLCVYFLLRLGPDRRFGGEGEKPTPVAVSDILSDRIAPDSYIEVEAKPLMAHAVRSVKSKGDNGLRVVPVRGGNDRLWLAINGDGWSEPVPGNRYVGRLRKLGDLALGPSVKSYVAENPRPMFATAAAARAGIASGKVQLVTGDEVAVADDQQVAFDVVEAGHATIIVSFGTLPDMRSWGGALKRAEIEATPAAAKPIDEALGQGRFEVAISPDDATKKLEKAELFAARVEPVIRHKTGTWGELKKSGADGLALGGSSTPDAQIDLVGIFVTRPIPDDAYAVVTGEVPQDYWYVLPITIALAVIGLLFAWALVRAIKRDLLPTRVPQNA
jgi:hypothetical protein